MSSNNIFSALLHDIGKIYYRITFKNHTKDAAKEIRNKLNGVMDMDIIKGIIEAIEKHHNSTKKLAHVILSDYLSALEREGTNLEDNSKFTKNMPLENPFDNNKVFPLNSLSEQFNIATYISNLQGKKELLNKKNGSLNLKEKNDKDIFLEEVKKIFNKVKDIVEDKNFIKNWLELMYLLERLTSFIPSASYKTEPSIPLFDHLKLAGTFYYLLTALNEDKNEDKIMKIKEKLRESKDKKGNYDYENLPDEIKNEKIGKFVVLDLSGIQNFIFNIYEKKKTVNFLKTRSLYLELILFLIVLDFFKRNNIPLTQILLLTAGKANLILRDGEDEKLKSYIKEINKILFEKFRTSLFVACGSMDLKIKHLFNLKEFKNDLKKLEREMSKQKLNKFKEEIIKWNKEIVENFDNYKKCDVCFNFYKENEFIDLNKLDKKDKEIFQNILEDKNTCRYCWSFVKLGEKLKKIQKYLEKNEDNKIFFVDLIIDDFLESGKNKNIDSNKLFDVFKKLISDDLLQDIKNLKISLDYYNSSSDNSNNNEEIAIRFPFSLHFPLKEESTESNKYLTIKTTEDLAIKENNEKLPLALVILDVDNLGCALYKEKIEECKNPDSSNNEKEDNKSPKWSKINFKSRLLNYFFAYYVPYVIKKEEKFKDNIYLIFSGGDDNIFFGRADLVLELLIKIRKDFKTLFGDYLTFSAAYVLFQPKENLRNVVDLAENLLKEAKNKIKEKDVLNLNGVPIKWKDVLENKKSNDKEIFENYVELKEHFIEYLKDISDYKFFEVTKELFVLNNGNYRSLIFRVLKESENIIRNSKENNIDIMPLIRIQYYMNRNIQLLGKLSVHYFLYRDKLNNYLEKLSKNLLKDNKDNKTKIKEVKYLLYFINYIVRNFFDSNLNETGNKFKNIITLIKVAENLY